MNIFVLDPHPVIAARSLCDKHVVKMTLESAQILSTVVRQWFVPDRHPINEASDEVFKDVAYYRATHLHHPCVEWAGSTSENYMWLYHHFRALVDKYYFRYNKWHKCCFLVTACHPAFIHDNLKIPPKNPMIIDWVNRQHDSGKGWEYDRITPPAGFAVCTNDQNRNFHHVMSMGHTPVETAVAAYRDYYLTDKWKICLRKNGSLAWTKRTPPGWVSDYFDHTKELEADYLKSLEEERLRHEQDYYYESTRDSNGSYY